MSNKYWATLIQFFLVTNQEQSHHHLSVSRLDTSHGCDHTPVTSWCLHQRWGDRRPPSNQLPAHTVARGAGLQPWLQLPQIVWLMTSQLSWGVHTVSISQSEASMGASDQWEGRGHVSSFSRVSPCSPWSIARVQKPRDNRPVPGDTLMTPAPHDRLITRFYQVSQPWPQLVSD